MLRFLVLLSAFILLTQVPAAHAGDEGLYPAAPPPGSAFVRFLNAGGAGGAAKIEVRGKNYGTSELGAATAYVPVPQGATPIKFGQLSASPDFKQGAHYVALLARGELVVLQEPAGDNPLKAQIVLINVSNAKDVSLKTADGSVSVVDAVGSGKLGARAVNAVSAPFAVYAGDKKMKDLSPRVLERGERYAVVVYDGADGKPAVSFN